MSDYSRQTECFNPEKFNIPINIVGCGATGSAVALLLAKLGVSSPIHLWDFDTIEEHNIPNQQFTKEDIGKKKVDACSELIEKVHPATANVITHDVCLGKENPERLIGYVFILTDTMASRSIIFNTCLKNNFSVPLVIETRMGLEMCMIYNYNPTSSSQTKEYLKTLYKDEESVESLCGISQTVAPSAMITASYAVWQMIKHFNKEEEFDNEIIFDFKYNNLLTRRF